MLVYIAMPTFLLPTMMAILAMGTHPTSTYCLETLLLIQEIIKVLEVGTEFNSKTSSSTDISLKTFDYMQKGIDNPMHAATICSNNHDQQEYVDLAAICSEI